MIFTTWLYKSGFPQLIGFHFPAYFQDKFYIFQDKIKVKLTKWVLQNVRTILDIFILDKSCVKSLKFPKNSRTFPGPDKIPGLCQVLGKNAKFQDFSRMRGNPAKYSTARDFPLNDPITFHANNAY